MKAAPKRKDEDASLAALHALKILDSEPEPEFDAIVRTAAEICGAPISLISLIDHDRQWFKANVGLPGIAETPRELAFCAHAVLGGDLFEVPDAMQDSRFADNPLVTGPPDIRFYAGAPVLLNDGICVGTLCVMDRKPRQLSEKQRETLRCLSRIVAHAMQGRYAIRETLRLVDRLSEQHELLRVTLQSVADGIVTTDAEGNVSLLNAVAERLTGWSTSEARGRALSEVLHVIVDASAVASRSCNHDLLVSRDGRRYGIERSVTPILKDDGSVLGEVCVFRDVTEQRRSYAQIAYRATHDMLTGLANRSEFETQLGRALHTARTTPIQHALMYIDLDQFKRLNDACGHAAGDRLLKQFARVLTATVRGGDTVSRLGGDEFAVILEDCALDDARRLAQEICDHMEDFRFAHGELKFRIGASIGVVKIDDHWRTEAALLQAADAACFSAKDAGRNRVHLWGETDLAVQAREEGLRWATQIEQALDENRFELFAQRIVPLDRPVNGVHAEILLRMVARDGALVPPGAFLPSAERHNLSSRIDRWVLLRTLLWLRSASNQTRVDMLSVNLSGHSVGDPAFHVWACGKLDEAGPALCSRLCFEITETAGVANLSQAAAFIAALRSRGVRVALDDFGSGTASFGYLKKLSVDFLKIDGQFVRDMLTDALNEAAVRCFVDVAKVVGMKTIAEFVESPAVMSRLERMGVDYAQGFLVHQPEPIDGLLDDLPDAASRAPSQSLHGLSICS
ncbi:EAL domain-containing protein [Variovorax sp. J31P179]|uniref:EAL domain-containing protein n=1 Tax=Variovorax sp. J31P179 TaxID=3053508 RepID=UPI0025790116|nr:EAL domain-containing protein [Variovorax sp. J31P179]MDM0085714.1 EAL domain-containing protein [Variovorax sp. J31P179]